MSRSYKRYPIVRQERVGKKTKKVMPNWDTC